ncbi:TetR family transcriptional regulator [Streptomyces sp. NPDC021080]|uniref:TetR/AcrR family transcriptional regulator n=1 Tax=Streptomyces sp. NPDC021080 TaxID=3365110 RepID=UPI0037ADB705
MQRRGRSHDPEGHRQAVLKAARTLFAAHGYTGVGIRAIASAAGVTPGLVMAYFGTKDGLFREAVGRGAGVTAQVLEEAGDDPARLSAVLARAYLDRWDRLPAQDPWPALIRSAVSHAPSAELLRTVLEEQVGAPLTRLLGSSAEADVRAAMVRSILFGVIMERYVFAHEPAASVPSRDLGPALADALATALAGSRGRAAAEEVFETHAPDEMRVTRQVPPAQEAGSPAEEAAGSGEAPAAEEASRSGGAPPSPTHLFALLSECSVRHRTLLGRTVREYGISLPAFEVLAALHESGEPYRRTTGEVADSVGAGVLTQHIDRLEGAGLLRRERDARDRRIVHLRLTAAGVELADRVTAVRSALEGELLAGLHPSDRHQLTELLGALGRTLETGGPER